MNWQAFLCALLGMSMVLLAIPLVLAKVGTPDFLHRHSDFHHTHLRPVPRVGGVVLVVVFVSLELFIEYLTPLECGGSPGRLELLLGSICMFGLGFWDDIRPLSAKRKLVAQVVIAIGVLMSGIGIQHFKIPFTAKILELGIWGDLFTVLWLVAMTNLINLIDGLDGVAGGICLMLMLLTAFVGHHTGNFELLACGMAGSLVGFLCYNFPPARVYLGDGGAYFLGFQIGLLAIINSSKGAVFMALIAPLFVLVLPILDTCVAILRRSLRGLPVFRPDRRHIHHRLIGMGLSQRRVVVWIYGVTLLFLCMAVLAYRSSGNLVPVLLGFGAVILLVMGFKLEFSRKWFDVGRVLVHSLRMRKQVRYALTLARWLELEGVRAPSVDCLFADLVFAAQKLGFSSLKLVFDDRTLEWRNPRFPLDARTAMFRFAGGVSGVLHVGAAPCILPPSQSERNLFGTKGFFSSILSDAPCPCVRDTNVFQITSELLAEAWSKSAEALSRSLDRGSGEPASSVSAERHSHFGLRDSSAELDQCGTPLSTVSALQTSNPRRTSHHRPCEES